jgi:hypothetical protein
MNEQQIETLKKLEAQIAERILADGDEVRRNPEQAYHKLEGVLALDALLDSVRAALALAEQARAMEVGRNSEFNQLKDRIAAPLIAAYAHHHGEGSGPRAVECAEATINRFLELHTQALAAANAAMKAGQA